MAYIELFGYRFAKNVFCVQLNILYSEKSDEKN